MGYKANNNRSPLKILPILCCLSFLFLTGCATTSGTTASSTQNTTAKEIDPFEDFNREMFAFNEVVDDYVVDPIVQAYEWVTPHFVQTGIGNFFDNLKDINVVLNDLLQGKFQQGGEDTGRFLMNTTIGVAGLFDVATEMGFKKHEEDFDQTFAVWGVPQGPYLVLPFLGATTGRGIGGSILDTAANPSTYVGYPVQLLSVLNERANADPALKIVEEGAVDKYIFIRDAYLQARENLITDGKSGKKDILDIDDLDDKETSNTNKSSSAPQAGEKKDTAEKAADTKKSPKADNQTPKPSSGKPEKPAATK